MKTLQMIGIGILTVVTFLVFWLIYSVFMWLGLGILLYGTSTHPDFWIADSPWLIVPISTVLTLATMTLGRRELRKSSRLTQ